MILVVGTLPYEDLSFLFGKVEVEERRIVIGGRPFPVGRGTAAIAAAAGLVAPGEVFAAVAGDTGRGEGSAYLYEFLARQAPGLSPRVICLGYVMPDRVRHDEAFAALKGIGPRPQLVADAGFMYVAKMAGKAPEYDLFCPDLGELAFLADDQAPHPFYTRGFIFHMTDREEELIARAYETGGAAKVMVVKGKRDFVVKEGRILAVVEEPEVPELEPIGGTGDTITGMAAALIAMGFSPEEAALRAARANRVAGSLASPTPATQIEEILHYIPWALEEVG